MVLLTGNLKFVFWIFATNKKFKKKNIKKSRSALKQRTLLMDGIWTKAFSNTFLPLDSRHRTTNWSFRTDTRVPVLIWKILTVLLYLHRMKYSRSLFNKKELMSLSLIIYICMYVNGQLIIAVKMVSLWCYEDCVSWYFDKAHSVKLYAFLRSDKVYQITQKKF